MNRLRLRGAALLGVATLLTFCAVPTTAGGTTALISHPRDTTFPICSQHLAPGDWHCIQGPSFNQGYNLTINSMSCTSSGNCSAGGDFMDLDNKEQALVSIETEQLWGGTMEVPGITTLGATSEVNAVSCASDGNCGAGGVYTDDFGNVEGFVVNETDGTWGYASQVVDPAAAGAPIDGAVESISCPAVGSCTAVGESVDKSGNSVGFEVSETKGTWGTANDISMTSPLGVGGTSLDVVSCTAPGACSAGGNGIYPDAALSGGFANIPFEVGETNGAWGQPSSFPWLANLNVGLDASVFGLSCSSPGNCGAGGVYTDASTTPQAFIANEVNGTWNLAQELPGTSSDGGALIDSISCPSNDYCAVSGVLTTGTLTQDFVADETNGTWGDAAEVMGSTTLIFGGAGALPDEISCGLPGDCSVGGAYVDGDGNFQAYVDNEKNGAWALATDIPDVPQFNTSGDADVTALSCSSDSGCGLAGYWSANGTFPAFFDDMTPLFSVQLDLRLRTTKGEVGSDLKLATSGGSGDGKLTFVAVDGSAKGCSITHGSLTARSAGTCVVTATKGSSSAFFSTSSTFVVVMTLPTLRQTLTVQFATHSSSLTPGAKKGLAALAKTIPGGAFVSVTGCAPGNEQLAKSRAEAAANYLSTKVKVHVSIESVTTASANSAVVVLTKSG